MNISNEHVFELVKEEILKEYKLNGKGIL